jgi:eukaryotic-like serine/threonine-protein kinase
MSETGRQWAGQIVDGKFELRAYLGGSESACVYATELDGKPAAIKLIHADRAQAKEYLLRWSRTAHLTHPSIARMFESGRCRIGAAELVYVVMERADETLAEILPQRALTAREVRDMLPPILDALAYLHHKGFAHGSVHPANILAIGEHVKISSDGSGLIGAAPNGVGSYDAPELETAGISPTADVWSLGMMMAEALTQQLPQWSLSDPDAPIVPADMPQPFLDIARNCLRRDPQRRWTIADVSALLRPPAPSLAPQVRQEESVRHAVPEVREQIRPPIQPPVETPARPVIQPSASRRWRAFVPAAVLVALAVIVILSAPKILERLQNRESRPAVVEAGPSVASTEKSAAPSAGDPSTAPESKNAITSPPARVVPAPPPTSTARISQEEAQGQVVQRVMPNVPQSALDTIRGTVRVGIRVEVTPSGDVSAASIDSPGPSKYFANLALKAASGWKFAPATVTDGNSARARILRFEFTQEGTKTTPTVAPE